MYIISRYYIVQNIKILIMLKIKFAATPSAVVLESIINSFEFNGKVRNERIVLKCNIKHCPVWLWMTRPKVKQNCAKCAIMIFNEFNAVSCQDGHYNILWKCSVKLLTPCKAERGVSCHSSSEKWDRNDEVSGETEQWHHSLPN